MCKRYGIDETSEAVKLLEQQGISIRRDLIFHLLQGCATKKDIVASRYIHSLMIISGLDSNAFLGDHLIRLFISWGSLIEANQVFCKISIPSIYTWNAIIFAHAKFGEGEMALQLYDEMQEGGIKPSKVTFSCILKVCSSMGALRHGTLIHEQIIRRCLESDVVIGSTLVDMYAKCGCLEEALSVFDELPSRNAVTWGAIIAGFVQHGLDLAALQLFEKMQQAGIQPSKFIFSCVVKACGSTGIVRLCRVIHEWIMRSELEENIIIGSTLVDMYAKCGSLEEARKVFNDLPNRNTVTWVAMVTGYIQHGHSLFALQLFETMSQEGIPPDKFLFSCILKACGSTGAIGQGRLIHNQMIRCGLQADVVLGNALVDMYARCGSLEEAGQIFDELPTRNAVSWCAVIAGYVQYDNIFSALELFNKMQQEGIKPNRFMFLCILKGCGRVGAIEQAMMIHDQIIRTKLETNVVIGSALINMYASFGNLEEAHKIFVELPDQNLVSWGAWIAGYVQLGGCRLVRGYLKDMQQQGLEPNDVIFTSILNAFSHAGLLEEGCQVFKLMAEDHGIAPKIEHYSCMVDLLGRAGCFCLAEDLLETMPMSPDLTAWISLMTGCRTHGNMELGRRCFEELVRLNPVDASGYVLMTNIYTDGYMWEKVDMIQDWKRCTGAWKKPGMAWVEVNKMLHEFMVENRNHPQSNHFDVKLKRLSRLVKEDGYVPLLNLVLMQTLEGQESA